MLAVPEAVQEFLEGNLPLDYATFCVKMTGRMHGSYDLKTPHENQDGDKECPYQSIPDYIFS
jgi:hypothetical protein